MFGELVGGAGCVGKLERVDEVFPGRPQSFRHQCRPIDECSPERGEMAQDGGTWENCSMTRWIAAEKARPGLQHAVVCPNVTGRTWEL